MYLVTIYDGREDTQGMVIQSPYTNSLKLSHGKVSQVMQGVPSFDFDINPKNPAWNRIKPLKTIIRVINIKTGKEEFGGRVLKPKQMMKNDGMLNIRYTAEGFLAYLQDSNQRHGEYHNMTVREFLKVILDNHNRQVEPYKRMKLGNVTVTNSTDNVYRYLGYDKTFDTIKDKLIDRLGGYLKIREESDGLYIDYLEKVGEVKKEEIRLRRNLKEMQREIDPTEVITRVIPLGTRIESGDPEAVDASQARLTIADVNGGMDYLDDIDMQVEFGIIEGTIVYDDINVPDILKSRGQQFIASQKAAKISYQITPVDLSLINQSLESFEIDNYYPIVNPLFNVDEVLQVIQKDINIITSNDIELVIGDQYRTLTQYQAEANKRAKQVVDLQNTVDSQTRTIANLQTETNNVKQSVQNIDELIKQADLPALEEAVKDLQTSINDLNNALDDIPIYEPATQTKDGLMSAVDKTKLDGLQNYSDATEEEAGLMGISDKWKLNRIVVTADIDLDQLYQDVQDLKNS